MRYFGALKIRLRKINETKLTKVRPIIKRLTQEQENRYGKSAQRRLKQNLRSVIQAEIFVKQNVHIEFIDFSGG